MRTTIQQKLFILSAVPLLLLLIGVVYYSTSEYRNYREVEGLEHFVELGEAASALMHEIQLERGISVAFLALYHTPSRGEFEPSLHRQRTVVTAQIDRFNRTLDALIASASDAVALQNMFRRLQQRFGMIAGLRSEIDSGSATARHVFDFFSTINQHISDMLRSYPIHTPDKVVTANTAALESLILMLERAGQERALLAEIFGEHRLFAKKLRELQNNIAAQAQYRQSLYHYIHDPETLGRLDAFKGSEEEQEVGRYREIAMSHYVKQEIRGRMKNLAGYGGMIHHFKNYVLRQKSRYYDAFLKDYAAFDEELKRYQLIAVHNPEEYALLQGLGKTFAAYRSNIEIVKRMIAQGRSPREIDRVVRVDDTPALQAIARLQDTIVGVDAKVWFDASTRRIEQLRSLEAVLVGQLRTRIGEIKSRDMGILAAKGSFALFFILALLALARYGADKIVGSIRGVQNGLTHFFDYLGHETEKPRYLDVRSGDEMEAMAEEINRQIERTELHMRQDRRFIAEATRIVTAMRDGDFEHRLDVQAHNPSLVALGEVFADLLILIRQKIREQTAELEQLNASLSDQVLEQTRALQEQLQALGQFQYAIDESMAVTRTAPDRGLNSFNARFQELSGLDPETLKGRDVATLLHPLERARFYREIADRVSAKEVFRGVLPLRRSDGGIFHADSMIIPLLDTRGNVTEYLGLHHDITPIIEARDQAIAAERSKDEFLSNMSHEIRTPLNAILGFVNILRRHVGDAKAQEYLAVIDSSGQSLLSIINDILDFSKIQSGKFAIRPEPFEPLRELSVTAKLFASKAYEKSQHYMVYIDPSLPECLRIDGIRLKQIFSNLVSNAIKFTPERGTIKVKTGYEAGRLTLMVQDSGIGIPESQQERIFSPFEQADGSTTRQFGGTGLGLSISSRLAQLMEGELSLKSREGSGSRFTLTLPAEVCDILERPPHDYGQIRSLSVGFIDCAPEHRPLMQLIRRYFRDFGVTRIVDPCPVETNDADMIVFVPESETLSRVINTHKPAIALLSTPETEIDREFRHIHQLHAPFAPTDVMEALDNATIARLRAEEASQPERALPRFSGHLLVAEDNATNRMLIGLILEEFGLTYRLTGDGLEALKACEEERFDLILMDENMPRLNGLAAMKAIRAYEHSRGLPQTPVIAVTANVMRGDRERFLAEGMDGFVGKPINLEELGSYFRTYLRMEEPHRG